MSKLGKYMADSPSEPPQQSNPTACLVHGCPLPGVYRQTNETSICCVHEDEEATAWAEQTTRIRNRERLFSLAFDMTNAPSGSEIPPRAVEKIVEMGGPEPKTREGERMTLRTYGGQIKGFLIRECKGPKTMPPAERHRADTWRSLRGVL